MKYPFSVYFTQVEDHQFWVAECKALKGCVAQGETIEEAIAELELNEEEWLSTAVEYGIPIPEIVAEENVEYSGKFTVRVSPYVHKQASELAKQQGVSLNQYVNDAIVSQNSALTTCGYILPKVKDAVKKISMAVETSFKSKTNQYYNVSAPLEQNVRSCPSVMVN